MTIPLKYATASQEVPLGYFLDSTDGDTEETGLTINNTDIKLWKNGATTLANKNSGGGTHISNGVYYCTLDATDTNTYGPLVIFIHVSGALACKVDCWVMEADAYDALFAASGTGHFDVDLIADTITSAKFDESTAFPVGSADSGATQIARVGADGDTLETLSDQLDVITADTNELQTDWTDGGRLDLILDAILADTNELQTDDTPAALTTIEGKIDTIDGIVDAILVDTAEIGSAGAGLTAVPWNPSWDTEVQSEVQDAIEVNHLDHLLAVDYDPASKPGTATALLNELVENDGGVSRFTVNALENAPSGSGASAETIADAVWDEARSGHVGAGSFGETMGTVESNIDNLDTAISTVDGKIDTVDSNVDAVLVDTGTTLPGTLTTIEGKIDTVDGVADAILVDTNELQTDWTNGGRLDLLIDAIKVVTDALGSTAAAKLALSAGTIVSFTVSHDNTAATTTVFYCDDITEATADHYNGRIAIFTSGALQNQATDITDYALVSGEGQFTVTALTEAPADNVTGIII